MTPDQLKELAARKAVEHVQDGMVVGLGTGSTAEHAIKALGERAATGLQIRCIPTSEASAILATEVGIDLVGIEDEPLIDVTIDGADEVNPGLDVLKGMGGALLREKIVAAASTLEIIIVDESKLVDTLGTRTPCLSRWSPSLELSHRDGSVNSRGRRKSDRHLPAMNSSPTTATSSSTAISSWGSTTPALPRPPSTPFPASSRMDSSSS